MSDEDDGEDFEPTAEDVKLNEAYYKLASRHPTFAMIMRIVRSRARMRKLVAMQAPDVVIDNERSILDDRLDDLCAAMPFDSEADTYPLTGIIDHFRDELASAPGTGDDA